MNELRLPLMLLAVHLFIGTGAWGQALQIATEPLALSVKTSEVAVFKVTTTGGGQVDYTWFKNNSNLSDTDRIAGTRSAQLTLCPVVASDAGSYTVRVTDGTNTLVSLPALLAVDVVLPVFTNAPTDLHVNSGELASFFAGATGTLPIGYAWQRNGVDLPNGARISGVGNATLNIFDATADDSGWYWLTGSNADGTISSEPARLYVHTASPIASATGLDTGAWTTGGNASWAPQSSVSRDGNALSHGTIGHNEKTWFETTVYGPGDVEFHWKVSSEGTDPLQFLVNGTSVDSISGEVDWAYRSFHLGSGPQVLRWQYSKDGSVVKGLDAGFVDQVAFTPTPQVSLQKALNTPPLPLVTYGNDRWFGQTTTKHDGASAARSGYLRDHEFSTVETTVSGPGWISFSWKVSSEGADPLLFLVDGGTWASISGEVEWTNRTFHIPWGVHTLSWRYQKDYSIARGSDAAWLDQVSYTPVRLFELAESADWSAAPWTSSGHGRWFGQGEFSTDGQDAMQSTPIRDSETAFAETTVTGPGTLVFRWKVSAEGPDVLRFLVNSNEWARISGETDWAVATNVIRPGSNLLRWQYVKDSSISRGEDAAWVDQVSFAPSPGLAHAVNSPHSSGWSCGGDGAWFSEMVTTHDGSACVRSGDISHNQCSVLETTIVGPGSGSFYWKVSSEGSDPLIFLIDDTDAGRISGSQDWALKTFTVPAGVHTLKWRYQKDYSVNSGMDAGWVDEFFFEGMTVPAANPVVHGTSFHLTVSSTSGRNYFLEYKNDLKDATWSILPGVSGTGLPLLLIDGAATNGQRFYRVRVE